MQIRQSWQNFTSRLFAPRLLQTPPDPRKGFYYACFLICFDKPRKLKLGCRRDWWRANRVDSYTPFFLLLDYSARDSRHALSVQWRPEQSILRRQVRCRVARSLQKTMRCDPTISMRRGSSSFRPSAPRRSDLQTRSWLPNVTMRNNCAFLQEVFIRMTLLF